MYIFSKFFLVGVLNTALDFLVLNLFLFFFGTGAHGELFILAKSISFLVAVGNSYFLNKHWVFRHTKATDTKEVSLFFIISLIGFVINVSVASAIFTFLSHTVSPRLAANIGALTGTLVVLAWNFIGYRSFVFRTSHE